MGIAPLITESKLGILYDKLKSTTRKPRFKKVCLKCFYWTGIGNIGNAYKCYCGSCPAKARDEAAKQDQLRGRNKRKKQIIESPGLWDYEYRKQRPRD